MAAPAVRRATYDDVLAAPDHVVAEVVGGELNLQPRPAARHALASTALGAELFGPFHRGRGGPGGWVILDEPELHLGADILVPDLAGWRRERMPKLGDDAAYFTVAPDWVCEVLSRSTAALDRKGKLPVYAREGVSHVWLVDPIPRTLEVLRRGADGWVIIGTWAERDKVRAEPFEAFELDLSVLWEDVEPGAG